MRPSTALLLFPLCVPLLLLAQNNQPLAGPTDDPRFSEIRDKQGRGATLTPEEQDYLETALERNNQTASAQKNAPYAKEHPPRPSTGLIPIPDLGKVVYKGEQGGLYPGGRNTPPKAHLKAGIKLAREIVRLDRTGRPSPDGKIVLLTIGYSNVNQESRTFLALCAKQRDLNPRMVIVNGAVNGQGAAAAADPNGKYWTSVAQRLEQADVTADQVQAVWMKQASGMPKEPFPAEVKKLQADVVKDLQNLHDKFPHLKIVYLSNRTYGGWAVVPTSPEPHAFESGFAFKWVIADQIAGKPEVNYDPAKGIVRAPWMQWGPYLWADGLKGRKDRKLFWERDDFGPDGTHPAVKGREKSARLLLEFLKQDPTSRPWFIRK